MVFFSKYNIISWALLMMAQLVVVVLFLKHKQLLAIHIFPLPACPPISLLVLPRARLLVCCTRKLCRNTTPSATTSKKVVQFSSGPKELCEEEEEVEDESRRRKL